MTNYELVLKTLNLMMPQAMKEHREVKRTMLKDNHRYWEVETPFDNK